SLLWYRDRVARLFGFDYRIQVYTPGPKRLHGYYTLPILHDGHLIGRVDAKAHRAEGRLEARGVHFEPWFAAGRTPPTERAAVDREAALAGLADALGSLATFVGASEVTIDRVTPGRLRPPLALRAPARRTALRRADGAADDETLAGGGALRRVGLVEGAEHVRLRRRARRRLRRRRGGQREDQHEGEHDASHARMVASRADRGGDAWRSGARWIRDGAWRSTR